MNSLIASRFLYSCLLAGLPCWAYGQTQTASDTDVQALQQQVDTLKTQVADLEDQIRKLAPAASSSGPESQPTKDANAQQRSDKPSEASKELKTEQSVSKATAQYQSYAEDQEAAARYDNAPLDPRYPN